MKSNKKRIKTKAQMGQVPDWLLWAIITGILFFALGILLYKLLKV